MLINYWDCYYSYAEEQLKDGSLEWVYYCDHPKNPSEFCICDNQWGDEEDDCEFLD